MPRACFLPMGLLLLAFVSGCSPYAGDFQYVPRPAMAELRSTSGQQAPSVTAMVSIIGVRYEDQKEGIPTSFEVRIRLENDGSQEITFDPNTLEMTNSQLLAFGPPIVRPPGEVAVAPMQSGNLTAYFPVPRHPPDEGALDSLQVRWIVQLGSQKISQSVSFRRVYPRVYYYGPYWGWPYWGYPPIGWYAGVVFVHRR